MDPYDKKKVRIHDYNYDWVKKLNEVNKEIVRNNQPIS